MDSFPAICKQEMHTVDENVISPANADRKPEPRRKHQPTPSSKIEPPGVNTTGSAVSHHRQRPGDLGLDDLYCGYNMDGGTLLTMPPATPLSKAHHANNARSSLATAAATAAADSAATRDRDNGCHAHFASPVKRKLSQDFMDDDFGVGGDDSAYTFPRDHSGQPIPTRWMTKRPSCAPVIAGSKGGGGGVAGGGSAVGGVYGGGAVAPTPVPDNGAAERRILNLTGRDNNFRTPTRHTSNLEGFLGGSPTMLTFPTSTDKHELDELEQATPSTTSNDLGLADFLCGRNGSPPHQQPKQHEPSPVSDCLGPCSGFDPETWSEVLQQTLLLSPNDQTTTLFSEVFSPVNMSPALSFNSSVQSDQLQGNYGSPARPLFLTTTSPAIDEMHRVNGGACPLDSVRNDDDNFGEMQSSLDDIMGDLWATESNMNADNVDAHFLEELVLNTRPEVELVDPPAGSVDSSIAGVGVEYNCDSFCDVRDGRQLSKTSGIQQVGFSISTGGTSSGFRGEFGRSSSCSRNTTWVLSQPGQRTIYSPTHDGGESCGRPTLMPVTPLTPRPSHVTSRGASHHASPLNELSLLSELLLFK